MARMKDPIDWLLEPSQPAIRYLVLTGLLGKPANDADVREVKEGMYRSGWVAKILGEQLPRGYWYSYASLSRPKYVATTFKLYALADLGATAEEPRVRKTCELLLSSLLRKDGGFGARHGGGDDEGHFCTTGNLCRTLIRCGYGDDPRVIGALNWIVRAQKEDGGWNCFPSKHGTLDCWEGLSAFAVLPRSKWTRSIKRSVERGAEFYLKRELHLEGREKYAPWFRFHYPVHYYYDLLVGLGVLTALGYGDDTRLSFALERLNHKRRPDGTWVLDAVHPDIGPGDPYQMKPPYEPEPPLAWAFEWVGEPSKVLTYKALKVLKRVERALTRS
jgi:hypothetical protein